VRVTYPLRTRANQWERDMGFNTRKLQATRSAPTLVAGVLVPDRWRGVLKAVVRHVAQAVRRECRNRAGSAPQLMVLLLVPMGFIGALAMDAGRLYMVRGEMQVAADAAALAAASSFLDGEDAGDSVQARAEHFVAANPVVNVPAILESLSFNADSGTLKLVLSYHTGPLILAPDGMTMRARAGARAELVKPGQIGRLIPSDNPLHWWKQDEASPGGADSGLVILSW
jgi:hypothetical protein